MDWLCINRDTNLTLTSTDPDGQEFLTFPFFQPGIYALILNPRAPQNEDFTFLSFLINKNTTVVIILLLHIIIFIVIGMFVGAIIWKEKRRQASLIQSTDVQVSKSLLPDFLNDPSLGIDKMDFIDKLLNKIKSVENSRLTNKNSKREYQRKYESTIEKNNILIARIKRLKKRFLDDDSINSSDDDFDELHELDVRHVHGPGEE